MTILAILVAVVLALLAFRFVKGMIKFAVLAVVVLVYAGALAVHANGFVAAFVAGLAFGSLADEAEEASLGLTEDLGQVLSLVVWFLFGAALVVPAVQAAVWGDVVFAVVALTVVRMVPVAAATLGAGLDRSTVALVGWFGKPVSPDPWGPEVTAALESSEATPICPHCQTPHEPTRWFCAECGHAVGNYNNWNPYLYIFSLGEVLREGTCGHIRKSWLTVTGLVILSFAEYFVLAPIYWFFLFRNLARKPAPTEPSEPVAPLLD